MGDSAGMMNIVPKFREFARDEQGATAIEYGLIAAVLSLVIITVVTGLGTRVNGMFERTNNAVR